MGKHLRLGIILFTVFGFFSFLVAKNVFVGLDFSFTAKLQDLIGDRLITFFSLFSIIGTVEIVSLVLLIALIIEKKLNKIYVLFLYAMTGVFELLGKVFVNQKGPPIQFLKTNLSLNLPSDHIPADFFSYPSGHSARTAFVSGVLILVVLISKKLSLIQKRILILGVLIFDFIMFVSRVYLGEHWLSDVVGGVILGFSLALIAGLFFIKSQSSSKR